MAADGEGQHVRDPQDRVGDERDDAADERDDAADARDKAANERDKAANERDKAAEGRERSARAEHRAEAHRLHRSEKSEHPSRETEAVRPGTPPAPDTGPMSPSELHRAGEQAKADREEAAAALDQALSERRRSEEYLDRVRQFQEAAAADRRAAAEDRRAAGADRRAAARDRDVADSTRQQQAVERAEALPEPADVRWDRRGRSKTAEKDEVTLPAERFRHSEARHTEMQEQGLELVRRAVALTAAIAGTEERIAQTLQDLGEQGRGELSERRFRLAREATQGAVTATQHGERLQRLAERSAEDVEVGVLQSLLHRAGKVLLELASTEQAIAAALDRLAHFDDGLATQRMQESQQAADAARHALRRAEELHRIAARPARPAGDEREPGPPATV